MLAKEILNDLGILKEGIFTHEIDPDMIKDDEMRRSYLRGAFLAGGSVNNPETSLSSRKSSRNMKVTQKV